MTDCLPVRKLPLKSTGFQGMVSSLKLCFRSNFPQNAKIKAIWQGLFSLQILTLIPDFEPSDPSKITQDNGTRNGINNYFFYHEYTMIFFYPTGFKMGRYTTDMTMYMHQKYGGVIIFFPLL